MKESNSAGNRREREREKDQGQEAESSETDVQIVGREQNMMEEYL